MWANEQSALLRGLAHALSNRVGTLVAAAGLLEPNAVVSAPIAGMLSSETARLEALLGHMRLLAGEVQHDLAAPEPIHLTSLVTSVVELHALHPAHRDLACAVEPEPDAPPARAPHDGLVRALLVLLSAAKSESYAARITWRADGGAVSLVVEGAPARDDAAAAAAALVRSDVTATARGYEMRLAGL